jgi:hypothetical protein
VGNFLDNMKYFIYIVAKNYNMIKVYRLIDPITNEVNYIGSTKKEILARLVGHLHECYHRERHFPEKSEWIKSLLEKGLIPKIELIEETTDISREKYYVQMYKPQFNIIFNMNMKHKLYRSEIRSIPVFQYSKTGEFIREWRSAAEVENILGIESTNISSCLSSKRKLAGDFMWRAYMLPNIDKYHRDVKIKEIHQYTLQGDYITSYPSANIDGFRYSNILRCCNGKRKSHKGFIFSFVKRENLRYSPILVETQESSVR